jgi:hypothetical protein
MLTLVTKVAVLPLEAYFYGNKFSANTLDNQINSITDYI